MHANRNINEKLAFMTTACENYYYYYYCLFVIGPKQEYSVGPDIIGRYRPIVLRYVIMLKLFKAGKNV